jgi:RHS repeat-associated protein
VFLELNGKTYIPIHDHRGCLVVLVNLENKKTTETYRYTAYGEQLTEGDLSPWRFSSNRTDPETGFVYFGRRYYSPNWGRWITPDPQGFEDGPNLYAYLHNCPLAAFDLYGLWTWRSAWDGVRGYWGGIGSSIKDIGSGAYHLSGSMGEWMYADFQYEHFNDRSFFKNKSQHGLEGWRAAGQFAQSAYRDPWLLASATGEALIPGVMEVYRAPTSAEAWGRATVDVALIGLSLNKIMQTAKAVYKSEKIVCEGTSIAKAIVLDSKKKGQIYKPSGIPVNWASKSSKKGGGIQYINPENAHDRIRVMPGNPQSSNPAQQRPYVIRQINGKFTDKNGNLVPAYSPEAHIPLDEFRFK